LSGHNQLTLEVKTTKGAFTDTFNVNGDGQKIVDEAIHKKKLDPHPPLPYLLKRARDGATLPLDAKIATYKLVDKDTVIVQPPEATDG
jgi:hypothetical protein